MRRVIFAVIPFIFVLGTSAAVIAVPPPPPVFVKTSVTPAVVPASQPVAPTSQPTTVDEAIEQAKTGVAFAKAKNWFGMASAAIFIIMFVLGNVVKLWEKIGKRYALICVASLSLVAMLLAKFAGGVSWEAAWLVLTSGPATALLNDLVKRGILGREPTTPMRIR